MIRFYPFVFLQSPNTSSLFSTVLTCLMNIGLFTSPEWADWVPVALNAFLLISMGIVWRTELDAAEDAREV